MRSRSADGNRRGALVLPPKENVDVGASPTPTHGMGSKKNQKSPTRPNGYGFVGNNDDVAAPGTIAPHTRRNERHPPVAATGNKRQEQQNGNGIVVSSGRSGQDFRGPDQCPVIRPEIEMN